MNIKSKSFLWIEGDEELDYPVNVRQFTLEDRIKLVEKHGRNQIEYIGYYEGNRLKKKFTLTEAKRIVKLKEI
jgi:hypothetical protein